MNQTQSGLRKAEHDLCQSGRIHRRTARRGVEAATDVLAVATDRLTRAEEHAAPTRQLVNELHNIVDGHRRVDSTRRRIARWDGLDASAHQADDLCGALDQWKHWADGRKLDSTALTELASTLRLHPDRPGINQLGQALTEWAQQRGLELQPPTPPPNRTVSRKTATLPPPSIGLEIDF